MPLFSPFWGKDENSFFCRGVAAYICHCCCAEFQICLEGTHGHQVTPNLDCPHFSAGHHLQTHPSILCFGILSIKTCKLYSSFTGWLRGFIERRHKWEIGRPEEGEDGFPSVCLLFLPMILQQLPLILAAAVGATLFFFWHSQNQLHNAPSNTPALNSSSAISLEVWIPTPRVSIHFSF